MKKQLKEKSKTLFYTAVGMGLMGITSIAAANTASGNQINGAINKGTSWLKALGLAVLALIALAGMWIMFTGIMALINRQNSQTTPGQAFGKTVGGLALILIPGIIAALSGDLGISSDQSSAAKMFGAGTGG